MRFSLISLVLALPLVSCVSVFPGDGVVRASGEIASTGSPTGSCEVAITDAEDLSRTLETRTVSGKFSVHFMVSPSPGAYVVDLACSGVSLGSKRIARPHQRAADFGKVIL